MKYQLKFPTYEELKALRTTDEDGDPLEIEVHLFTTPVSVYGRFTLWEDGFNNIIFDLMEDGYCGKNNYEMQVKFNKKNYAKICSHANYVYNEFINTLLNPTYYIYD